VVVDAGAGFGNGRMLPYGPLREPLAALGRAHLIWLREAEPSRVPPLPEEKLVRVRHTAAGVLGPDGAAASADALQGQKVVAFAGIARPESFFRSVAAAGATLSAQRAFGDHHPFTAAELAELKESARTHGARLVTTEKDLQRLPPGFGAWALRVQVSVTQGLERLAAALGLDPSRAP
jgi:tetraacyldisaccharide 4'-kinase